MRVVVNGAAWGEIDHATSNILERVADAVADDARRFAPVRTGYLRSTIERGPVEGDSIKVNALAHYAAYVELGHRIVAWGHETGKFQPPQPYLRPALYRTRTL